MWRWSGRHAHSASGTIKGADKLDGRARAGRRRADGFEIPPGRRLRAIAVVSVGDAVAYQQAMKSLRPRGCLVLFWAFSRDPPAMLDFNAMHYLEQRVAGAYGCTYEHSEEAIRCSTTATYKSAT